MEITYCDLRQKEVVNLCDGKRLGRVIDMVFSYPENRIIGIVVPGCRGFYLFRGNDIFVDIKSIIKIGEDVILIDVKSCPTNSKSKKSCACEGGYSSQDIPKPNSRLDTSEYE